MTTQLPFLSRKFVFPGPRDRVCIVGRTGSGKSTFGLWLLSEAADFDKKPWIFIDYKREDIITSLEASGAARTLTYRDQLPHNPGLYVIHPSPDTPREMADFLWRIYQRGKTGVFCDEAYLIPEYRGEAGSGGPFQAILTQGRSKEIPVYSLTQRPVRVNKSVFTESNFMSVFKLRSDDDLKTVASYMPDKNVFERKKKWLQREHCSLWYDELRDQLLEVKPCPPAEQIIDAIEGRMKEIRKRETV